MEDLLKDMIDAAYADEHWPPGDGPDDIVPKEHWAAYHGAQVLKKKRIHGTDYLTWMTMKAVRCGLDPDTASDIRECTDCSSAQSILQNMLKIPKAQLAAVGY